MFKITRLRRRYAALGITLGLGCAPDVADTSGNTPPPTPPPVTIPLAIAVTPALRKATATSGTAAPTDNALITITGDGAASTAWTAAKRQAWTTLLSAAGTGTGVVQWSRSTTGLSVGWYVDTITVSVTGGAVPAVAIIDSFQVTALPVPLSVSASPTTLHATIGQGSPGPSGNVAVSVLGDGSSTVSWTASNRASWNALVLAGGQGSGSVAWQPALASSAPGTYVDTITVTANGVTGSPIRILDSVTVTAAPVPVGLMVTPASRSVNSVTGNPAAGGNAQITLTGDNAAATSWTATNRKSWTTLTASSGTGTATLNWTHNTTGLVAGIYVDTIAVVALCSACVPAQVIDSVVITNAPVPLALAVTPPSHSVTAVAGDPAIGGSATVTLTGDNAPTSPWTASKRQNWTTLAAGSGTGGGVVSWSHNTAGLAAGIYVDTIAVAVSGANGSPARVIDTLVITPAPIPLTLTVSPGSRSTAAVQGSGAAGGSATVALAGDNAATTAWSAGKKKSWTSLTGAAGTGSGTAAWTHSTSGLTAGTYVDTITITASGAAGSPGRVIDTLVVTPAPVPLTLAVTPGSHTASAVEGSPAIGGSATVTLSGDNASTTAWTGSKRKSWTSMAAGSGSGSGVVSWSHNTTGLTAGTYVDTINVTATGASGSPGRVIDTLVITAAAGSGGGGGTPDLGLNANLHGKQMFPASNLWNVPIDTAQIDPGSAVMLGLIGLGKSLHPDFGADYGGPFGLPYIVVPDNTPRSTVTFDYDDESDHVGYPIPANAPVEPGDGDNHLLMITQGEWKAYELYGATKDAQGNWHAGSGAVWDLSTGAPRPVGWTSADAAGLPIIPGLVRYDEVYQKGEIDHALRFTVQYTRGQYVPPASHITNYSTNPAKAPMGMRVRLRASFDISGYPPQAQVILRALKKYGMIVADNGSDFFLSGAADARWNDDVNNTLKQVHVGDFEVIRMDGLTTPP
jgi:hypothetical protein